MRSPDRMLYVCLFSALIAMTPPARATLITYTTPAAFAAAASGLTTIDFEGIATANSFTSYNTAAGLTVSGVQFIGQQSATAYSLQVVNPGATTTYYDWGSGAGLKGPSYNIAGFTPYIDIDLPASISALGVDLMTGSPNGLTYQVSVAGSNFTIATATRPTRTFFGVTSSAPFSTVRLTLTGTVQSDSSYALIDNVKFGAAGSQTAEASSLVLIGSGLAMLGSVRRRVRWHASGAASATGC